MNPEKPSRDEIEARLTALLLGELPADEARVLRQTVAQDPDLAKLHDRLKATIGLVRHVSARPVAPETLKLSEDRRQKLLEHFKTPRKEEPPLLKPLRISRLVEALVVVAVVALLASLLLPAMSGAKRKGMFGGARQSLAINELSLPVGGQMEKKMEEPASVTIAQAPRIAPPPAKLPPAPQQPAQIYLPSTGEVAQAQTAGEAGTQNEAGGVESMNVAGYVNVKPSDNLAVQTTPVAAPPPVVMAAPMPNGIEEPSAQTSPSAPVVASAPAAATEQRLQNVEATFDNNASTPPPAPVTIGAAFKAAPPASSAASDSFQWRLGNSNVTGQGGTPASQPAGGTTFARRINGLAGGGFGGSGGGGAGGFGGGSFGGGSAGNYRLQTEQPKVPDNGSLKDVDVAMNDNSASRPPVLVSTNYFASDNIALPAGAIPESPVAQSSLVRDQNVYTYQLKNANTQATSPEIRRMFQSQTRTPEYAPGASAVTVATTDGRTTVMAGTQIITQIEGVTEKDGRKVPVVGDVPVTGSLFADGNRVATSLPSAQSEAATLDQDGKLLYEMGKLDEAKAKLDEARKLNPNDQAANYYWGLISQSKTPMVSDAHTIDTQARNEQVEKKWVNPSDQAAANSSGAIVGMVNAFSGTSARYPLVNMQLGNGVGANTGAPFPPAAIDPQTGLPIPAAGGTSSTQLYTKAFKLPDLASTLPAPTSDNFNADKVQEANVNQGQGGVNFVTQITPSQQVSAQVRQYLKSQGVDLASQPGKAVFYNDRTHMLLVKGTADDLAVAQRLFQSNSFKVDSNKIYSGLTREDLAGLHYGAATQQQDLPLRQPAPNAPIPQPEVQVSENAFSTFAMNVSDVSFKLAKASLEKGVLPDASQIRSEEFINAFDYRDPEAAPGQPIAFNDERAQDPFEQNRDFLRFSIKTAALGRQAGRPLNLVLLLDNSGSMERADRVAIIREALRVLASQLSAGDTVSVVTFARTATLWIDGIPGDKAGAALEKAGDLTPQGGTNLEEAMRLAYETARRHYLANGLNRVVLLTDGAANLGNVDARVLTQKVEDNRRQGIALDCFGIGWEDYNDDLLEQLTSHGDGRYAFLNSPADAANDFAAKLAGALQIAAEEVKVQVEFNPDRVIAYRQIGYAKHQLTKEQFRDNTVAAGEIAAQEAGNALYTVELKPDGSGPIATVRLRYRVPGTQDYRERSWNVDYTGHAPALDRSGPAMRLCVTSAEFAEWLATSPYAQQVTLDQLMNYLSGVPEKYGADTRPKELEWMIRQAQSAPQASEPVNPVPVNGNQGFGRPSGGGQF